MNAKIEIEHMGYLSVISMSAEGARQFFGMPSAHVEDGGPVPEEKRERFDGRARVWRVYLNGKPAGAE